MPLWFNEIRWMNSSPWWNFLLFLLMISSYRRLLFIASITFAVYVCVCVCVNLVFKCSINVVFMAFLSHWLNQIFSQQIFYEIIWLITWSNSYIITTKHGQHYEIGHHEKNKSKRLRIQICGWGSTELWSFRKHNFPAINLKWNDYK